MKASPSVSSFVCMTCRHQAARTLSRRAFTTTHPRRAEKDQQPALLHQAKNTSPTSPVASEVDNAESATSRPDATQSPELASMPSGSSATTTASDTVAASSTPTQPAQQTGTLKSEIAHFRHANKPKSPKASTSDLLESLKGQFDNLQPYESSKSKPKPVAPHRLYVYSHRHNTHLTLTQAPRLAIDTVSSDITRANASAKDRLKEVDVLMSMSTGVLGFRHSARGTYDAAFQLGAYFLKQMKERGMLQDLRQLEVVMRGFGSGREAMQKILLGTEGRLVKDRIVAVMDATRLKIGGCRSPKPRRL